MLTERCRLQFSIVLYNRLAFQGAIEHIHENSLLLILENLCSDRRGGVASGQGAVSPHKKPQRQMIRPAHSRYPRGGDGHFEANIRDDRESKRVRHSTQSWHECGI
jgi:hypothetical protein